MDVRSVSSRSVRACAGPLYRTLPWLPCCVPGAIGIGIGQAAIDELISLATEKTPAYTDRPIRSREVAQRNVARGQASLNAARAYLHQAADVVYRAAQAGRKPTLEEGISLQLAACNGLETG